MSEREQPIVASAAASFEAHVQHPPQESLSAEEVAALIQETRPDQKDEEFFTPAEYNGRYFKAILAPSLVLNHVGYIGLPVSPRKLLEHGAPETYAQAVASFQRETNDALTHAGIQAGKRTTVTLPQGDERDMLQERRVATQKVIRKYKADKRKEWRAELREQLVPEEEIKEQLKQKTQELFVKEVFDEKTGKKKLKGVALPEEVLNQIEEANNRILGEKQEEYIRGIGSSLKYGIRPTGENGEYVTRFNPETGQTTADVYSTRRAFHWYRLLSNPQVSREIAEQIARYEFGHRRVLDSVFDARVDAITEDLLDLGRVTGNGISIETTDGRRADTRRSGRNGKYRKGQGTGTAFLSDQVLNRDYIPGTRTRVGMRPAVTDSFTVNVHQENRDELGIKGEQISEIQWTSIITDLIALHDEVGGKIKLLIDSRQASQQIHEHKQEDIKVLFELPEKFVLFPPSDLPTLEKLLTGPCAYPPTHAVVESGDAFHVKFDELLATYRELYKNYPQINIQRLAYAHAKAYTLDLLGRTDDNYAVMDRIVTNYFAEDPTRWTEYVAEEAAAHEGDRRYQPRNPHVLPTAMDPTIEIERQGLKAPENFVVDEGILSREEVLFYAGGATGSED